MYVVLSCQLVRVVGGVRTFFRIFVLSTCPYPERQKHRSYAIIYFKSYQYTRISRIVGIVIKFLQFEFIGRLPLFFRSYSSFFISSALFSGPIFSFSVTSGATTPAKSCSTRGTSGCKSYLDRLSSCKVDHICCVDTEEDQHDLCRFYPRRYLSKSVIFFLSSK